MEDVAKLVTTKPDQEIADDMRRRMTVALGPVCDLLNEASAQGLLIEFQVGQMPPFNRIGVLKIGINKPL